MSGIDYSKWDKFGLSDDDDDDEDDRVASSSSNDSCTKCSTDMNSVESTQNSDRPKPPDYDLCCYAREKLKLLDPPEEKTRFRRRWEYDWLNMTQTDRDELALSTDRLDVLDDAFGYGMTGLASEIELDFNKCKDLYKDIKEHKDIWLEELFHPLECHMNPSHCARAFHAIEFVSRIYYKQKKYKKALSVVTFPLKDILECMRVQIFENRIFTQTKETKQKYRIDEYRYHMCRYKAASMLDIKDESVQSFRKCTELELMRVAPGGQTSFIEYLELLMDGSLTMARLQREVTDDYIWSRISTARSFRTFASPTTLDFTKMCSACASQDNLTLCPCGNAAYCSVEHKYTEWENHKEYCKCACCGSNKDLKLCTGCLQPAYCSKACQLKSWPNHKADCKKACKESTGPLLQKQKMIMQSKRKKK